MNLLFLLAQSDAGARAAGFGLAGFGIITLILAALATVFWIWMIVDCATSSLDGMQKIVWLLVIFFLHLLGALIYYFVGRRASRVT